MVAIVSGNSLGLGLSSWTTLGQRGVFGDASLGRTGGNGYVNVATGNLVLQGQDESLMGRGLDVAALRTYNSQGRLNDDNGDNWSVGIYRQQIKYNGAPELAATTLTRTGRDGAEAVYSWNTARARYVSSNGFGAYDTIRPEGVEYVWTDGDTGEKERYDITSGCLSSHSDAQGNTVAFTYHGDGNIASMKTANGETLFYDYSGNKLTQLRTVTADAITTTRVRYGYDGSNRLSTVSVDLTPADGSVADAKTYTTTYTYDGTSKRVASVAGNYGSYSLNFSYVQVGAEWRVESVMDGLNPATKFSYDPANRRTTMTDPMGHATVYEYDTAGQLTQVTTPAVDGVAAVTRYEYNASGDLETIIDGEGRALTMRYDLNGNQILQRDAAGDTIERTFNANNQLLTQTKYLVPDPDGNGGALPSEPATERYVYDLANKNRLRFVISAEGRVTEHQYNAFGERISTIQYVAASYALASLSSTGVPSETTMAMWTAAQPQGQITRTDMSYDARGQLKKLVSFSNVDASTGAGLWDSRQTVKDYIYVPAGQLLTTIEGNGTANDSVTSYTYDGMGRLLTVTDALQQTTITAYQEDGGGSKVNTIYANGLSTNWYYNRVGQLAQVWQTGSAGAVDLGTTHYFYDPTGRLAMTEDPSGQRAWLMYDEAGRQIAAVDSNGSVTEYRYNNANELVRTTKYKTPLDRAALDSLYKNQITGWRNPAGVNPIFGTNADDVIFTGAGILNVIIGSAGRDSYIVSGDHGRSDTLYFFAPGEDFIDIDGLLRSIGYLGSDPFADGVVRLVHTPPTYQLVLDKDGAGPGAARVLMNIHGQEPLQVGQIVPGRDIRWAGVIPKSLKFSELGLVKDPLSDVDTWNFYDAAGRLFRTVDALGYVTETRYDGASRVLSTIRYANAAQMTRFRANPVVANAVPLGLNPLADRVTRNIYDADGLLRGSLDGEGFLVEYLYDSAGRLVKKLAYETSVDAALRATGNLDAMRPGPTLRVYYQPGNNSSAVRSLGAFQAGDVVTATVRFKSDSLTSGRVFLGDSGGPDPYDNAIYSAVTYGNDGWKTITVSLTLSHDDQLWLFVYGDRDGAYRKMGNFVDFDGIVVSSVRRPEVLRFDGSLTGWSFNQAKITDASATHYLLNGLGQVAGEVDAEGYLTERVYDARGHLAQEIRYAMAVNAAALASITSNSSIQALRPGSMARDRSQSWHYDALGRLDSETNAEGTVTSYEYNPAGQLIKTNRAVGRPEVRTLSARYDLLGRLTGELSAEGGALLTGSQTSEQIEAIWAQYGTHYSYDLAGRRTSVVVPGGARTLCFYNEDGLQTHTVNALGEVEERQYDGLNQLVRTIRYGGRIAAGTLGLLGGGLVTTAITDAVQELLTQTPPGSSDGYANARTEYSYSQLGQVLRSKDTLGFVTNYAYNAFGGRFIVDRYQSPSTYERSIVRYDRRGLMASEVQYSGLSGMTTYRYDAFGRLESSIDANGVGQRWSHDRLGRVVEHRDGLNTLRRTGYDAFARVLAQVDAYNRTTTYSYNDATRSVEVLTAAGVTTTTTRNRFGETESVLDGNGKLTRYTYNRDGKLTATSGEELSTGSRYDELQRLIESTDANGIKSRYEYDKLNRVKSSTLDPSGLNRKTSFDYLNTEFGSSVITTEPTGIKTRDDFDLKGQLLRHIEDADGLRLTTHYTYDGVGHQLTVINARSVKTTYTYDAAGRRIAEVADDGGLNLKRSYRYDLKGNLTAVTQGNGDPAFDRVTVYAYDALGRQTLSLDAMGGIVEQVYDLEGNVVKRVAYAAVSADAAKLAAARTNPSEATLRAALLATPAQDRIELAVFDADGRKTHAIDAEGGVTKLKYDGNGNVIERLQYARALTPAQMAALPTPVTTVSLSVLVAGPMDRKTSYRYDTVNRLRFEVDALGYVTETRYNGLETTSIRYKNPVATPLAVPVPTPSEDLVTTQVLDAAGRVVSSIDAMGVQTFSYYDDVARTLEQTRASGLPEASTTLYTYDAVGRVRSKTIAYGTLAAATTLFEYNALGQVTHEVEARGVALAQVNSAWARSERLNLGLPEDASALSPQQKLDLQAAYASQHEYDNLGRRTKTTNALGATTLTQYDAFGNAVKVTDPRGNTGYFYFDKLNRVTLQVDPEGYATQTSYWNAASNQVGSVRRFFIKVASGTTEAQPPVLALHPKDALTINLYDRLDRLVSSTDAANATDRIEFGVDGNRFDKRVTNKLGGVATYRYDTLGQQVSETLLVNVNGTTVVNVYAYDAFGNRSQTIEAQGLAEQRITTYRYDKAGRQTQRIGSAYPAIDAASLSTRSVVPVEQTVYDGLGRVIESLTRGHWNGSSVEGGRRSLSYYDAAGNKLVQIAPDGALIRYEYDTAGHVVRESAMANRVALPASAGGVPPSVAPDSAVDRHTRISYDALGRLVEKQREAVQFWEPPANSDQFTTNMSPPSLVILRRLSYDATGNVLQEVDGRGNSVYSYYDKLGRKLLRIDQEGYAIAWDYDDFADSATRETRYAGRVSAYARQDDAGQALALRDPATLRAGLSLTDVRISTFELDRLGRVLEKRTLNVDTQFVDANGVINRRTADAITQYLYDGLGHVKQILERVGITFAGQADVWNQTDVEFDKIGRETRRLEAAYTDHELNLVRPETSTEYNGLGAISRNTRRGRDAASELDDRMTRYDYNANGDRIGMVDAEGNFTRYELDAQGQAARVTMLGVLDADGNRKDLVKRYQYDAMDRMTVEIVELAPGSTDVRKTRYNTFGEVSGKGLGDGWQEFAQYNTLGKVLRNNSGDGAAKIYLYDRNGNSTREIQGGAKDLTTMAISDAAQDVTLNHTFSAYDKRNQLIKTVDIGIAYKKDELAAKGAFSQQLVEWYGAISLQGVPGTASGAGSGQFNQPVAVSGAGSVSLPPGGAPTGSGELWKVGLSRPTPAALGTVTAQGYAWDWSATVRLAKVNPSSTPSPMSVQVPANYPDMDYEIWEWGAAPALVARGQRGASLLLPMNYEQGYGLVRNYTLFARPKYDQSERLPIADLKVVSDVEREYEHPNQGLYITRTGSITATRPYVIIPPVESGVVRYRASVNGGAEIDLSGASLYDSGKPVSGSLFQIDLSGYAANVVHTCHVTGYDSQGNPVAQSKMTFIRNEIAGSPVKTINGIRIVSNDPVEPRKDVTLVAGVGQFNLSFDPRLIGSDGSSPNWLFYRKAGINDGWRPINFGSSTCPFVNRPMENGVVYEYLVYTKTGPQTKYHGTFTGKADGTVTLNNNGMLYNVVESNPVVTVSFSLGDSSNWGASYSVNIWINGRLLPAQLNKNPAVITLADILAAGIGVSEYAKTPMDYRYEVTTTRNGYLERLSHNQGVLTFTPPGSIEVTQHISTPLYKPYASLSLSDLALGNLRMWSALKPSPRTASAPPAYEALGGGKTWLDLGYYMPASGSSEVSFDYNDGLRNFSGKIRVSANGLAEVIELSARYTGKTTMSVGIEGIAQAGTLRVGTSPSFINLGVRDPVRWNGATKKVEWDLRADEFASVGTTFYYEYETVNSDGVVNGKVRGSYSMLANGQLNVPSPQLLIRPALVKFSPPYGTAATAGGFELQVRGLSPATGWQTVSSEVLSQDNLTRLVQLDGRRPASGSASLQYQFVARNAYGTILTQGAGDLSLAADGQVTFGGQSTELKPLPPLVFLGPLGKIGAAQLSLRLTRANEPDTIVPPITGSWDGSRMRYIWSHPFDGRVFSGRTDYDFEMRVLDATGQPFLDEVGDPVVMRGVATFGTSATEPLKLKQYATALNQTAQVKRLQEYNAFGEIIEEYDQRVQDRAQKMVEQYQKAGLGAFSVDASAMRTKLSYNALGGLIAKQGAETFETLANGFVRRIKPQTEFGYDLLGRMTVSKDANGNISKQNYAGSLAEADALWAGDGGKRTQRHDILGDARQLIDELGAVVDQTFNANGRLTKVERRNVLRAGVGNIGTLTDRYEYDALGRRISHTDALNLTDRSWYDSLGRITKTRSAAGRDTQYSYQLIAANAGGDAIISIGGKSLGGFKRTTLNADGRSLVDKIDYFGRTTWHLDLGGNSYNYIYNAGGQLSSQDSSKGQNIQYSYLLNGFIAEAKDMTEHTASRYGYDDAGNRVYEAYVQLNGSNSADTWMYQSSTIAYDELNRMAHVWDGAYKSHDVRYEYDAVGNRRAVTAVYWDPLRPGDLRQIDSLWYTYDAANRFTTTKGSLTARGATANDTNGRITRGLQGISLEYNQAGQRVKSTAADGTVEDYSYSTDGFLEDTSINGTLRARRAIDAEGRTLVYREWEANGVTLRQTKATIYDNDNRVQSETVSDSGANNGSTNYFYEADKNDLMANASLVGSGALTKTVFTPHGGGTTRATTYTYEYWDSAKQSGIMVQASNEAAPYWAPGQSRLAYNVNGHLRETQDRTGTRKLSYFSNAQGLVLDRYESQGVQRYERHYYYASGRRIGDVTTDPTDKFRMSYAEQLAISIKDQAEEQDKFKNFKPVTSADFDQNYEPINANYPAATSGSYTVRSGDTLSSIAQSVWGDSAMWYLLADANGLSGSETLTVGQVLVVPNKVTNIHNNANTFRPYNPGEVIGNIDPTLPAPPPPTPDGGCGGLGTLLMIVVAVVVTIYTAGAAAPTLGATGTTASGVVATTAASVSTFHTGLAVLAGGTGAGASLGVAAASAAIGAAAGSVASQLTGLATGNLEKFSWKAVGQAAFSGGVTSGVGNVLSSLGTTSALGKLVNQSGWQGAAMRAGAGSAVSQALQGQWSWREVAASTVGGAAGYAAGDAVGRALNDAGSIGRVAASTAVAVAGGWASSQVLGLSSRETRARVGQAFISGLGSGLGNAIGDSFAESMRPDERYSLGGMRLRENGGRSGFRLGGDVASDAGSSYTGGQDFSADLLARSEVAAAGQVDALLASVGSGGVSIDSRPGSIYVQSGDNLSRIAARWVGDGASAAQVNDLKNQFIAANSQLSDPNRLSEGQELNYPGASTAVDSAAVARAVGADARYLSVRQPQAQEPVWSFREASRESLALYAERAKAELRVRLDSRPQMSAITPEMAAAARATEVRRESLLNFLNGQGNMALGGVAAAGVMIGTRDVVAASAATDAMAPLDNLLAPMGGTGSIRASASVPRRPVTREGIVGSLGEVVQPHLDSITRLDPDALIGFRGGLARGFKGPHKGNAPFNTRDFDVDAFIVSDQLAAPFSSGVPFRNGAKIPEVREVQQAIDNSLRQSSEFSGLRDEPFTFRIYTRQEIQRLQTRQDAQYFFLKPKKQ
ncbi:MAG: LysM peptidoglycan-binding domain-containing protein [Burkholderiaceae bacterium]|nr:LysM peptidoglycan-binding domain-containing protein [Burkholderiaceae bacterium]